MRTRGEEKRREELCAAPHASFAAAPSNPYSTAARHASFVRGPEPCFFRERASGKHASHAEQLCTDATDTAVADVEEPLRERLEVRECYRRTVWVSCG